MIGRVNAPVDLLGNPVVRVTDVNHVTLGVSLTEHSDQALKVEVTILPTEADPGHMDGEVTPLDDRDMTLAVHVVADAVDVATFLVFTQACAGVGECRAEAFLDPVAAGLDLGLKSRCVVADIGRSLLGGQAGPTQLSRLDQSAERLPQVNRGPGIVTRVWTLVPAVGTVETRQEDLEKLGFVDQADGDKTFNLEARVRLMGRDGKPMVTVAKADDHPQQGE